MKLEDSKCYKYVITKIANIWDPVGDAFVRELDFSKITLRLRERVDSKGDDKDNTYAKLVGDTLDTLKTCLVSLSILVF